VPDFRLPDLGEGLEEASVVAWRVDVGEQVDVDQVVLEVETAKAAVEVPVPFAGTVTARHAEPGQSVRVGAPLLTVEPVPAGFREPGVVSPTEEASGNVLIGYGTTAATRRPGARRRRRSTRPAEAPTAAAPVAGGRADGPVPVISPLVRKMARDAGLDLTAVVATGERGIVRRSDVERALAGAPPPADGPPRRSEHGQETRIPLTGVRRVTAEKLARSRREIPEATVWVDVDATELLRARAVLNDNQPHQQVSVLALLARFTVLALRRYPELNARLEGDEIVVPEAVNLGFAAQTDRGLVVPVVPGAHRLSTRELSARLSELTRSAREGTLTPDQLTGGTCTVNNYGVFGVDGSAAIINHPEVALVGMGRIIDRPWVVDGELAVRKVTQLTLAFDHRVCDGGTAGGFLRFLADCIEAPVRALGDL
jgi:pyruvate dehydrogenase E2 component (dihydrolipoamide acetyltransferase)